MKKQPHYFVDDNFYQQGMVRFSRKDFEKLIKSKAGTTQEKNLKEGKAPCLAEIVINLIERVELLEKDILK